MLLNGSSSFILFSLSHHKGVSTWWKDTTIDHLTAITPDFDDNVSSHANKDPSLDEVVPLTTEVASVGPLVASGIPALRLFLLLLRLYSNGLLMVSLLQLLFRNSGML